jgi:hypothetical protein
MTPARWLLAGCLVLVLFIAGVESETIFAVLTRAWQAVFETLGLGSVSARWQHSASTLVAKRSLPATATYNLAYVGLSLLLLHVLLRDGRRTRWAAQIYAVGLGLYIILVVADRLGGSQAWALNASRRIINFVVSPLPIMMLLPMLWPGMQRFFNDQR